jgi:hypothetical protein
MVHNVWVVSHWHNDDTSGVRVECECGGILLDHAGEGGCPDRIRADEVSRLRWEHISGPGGIKPCCCDGPEYCSWCGTPR